MFSFQSNYRPSTAHPSTQTSEKPANYPSSPNPLTSGSEMTIYVPTSCPTCQLPPGPPTAYTRTPGFSLGDLFQRRKALEQILTEEDQAIREFYRGFIKDHVKKKPDMRLRLSPRALEDNVSRAMKMGEWLMKSQINLDLAWQLTSLVMYDFCVLLGLSAFSCI